MPRIRAIASLLTLAVLVQAKPLEKRVFNPFSPCYSCFSSTWTHGPECTTESLIESVLSVLTNPPATATDYNPSHFCSDVLQQTDVTTTSVTSTGIRTYTDETVTHVFATVTDYDHPTSTVYCPIASPGMVCGISNPNIIAPGDQDEIYGQEIFEDPWRCHQSCLGNGDCKAFRAAPYIADDPDSGYTCELFALDLGQNGSNVISASSGYQWWDRNCPVYVPSACGLSTYAGDPNATPTDNSLNKARRAAEAQITPGPQLVRMDGQIVPQKAAVARHAAPAPAIAKPVKAVEKRSYNPPDFLSSYNNVFSSFYVAAACSCLLTSASPVVHTSTTTTIPVYTDTVTTTSTFVDLFTVTETPRSTTTYSAVN